MGTNYYAMKKEKPYQGMSIHLGKSSCGWLFLFREHDDIKSFPQFKSWLESHVATGEYVLMNEYGEEISVSDLLDLIETKQNDKYCRGNPDNFENCRNVDGYRFVDCDFS